MPIWRLKIWMVVLIAVVGILPQRAGAETACEAILNLGMFAALDAGASTRDRVLDTGSLRAALRAAAGSGQLQPAETAAFERYITQKALGAAARFPLSTAELRRRHALCEESATPRTVSDAAQTPSQVSARHGLPTALPGAPPSKSLPPDISQGRDTPFADAALPLLRFNLAVILSGLLIWLATSRLHRIAQRHKRRAKRYVCNLPVVFSANGTTQLGRIIDLSGVGCKLDTRGGEFAKGDQVTLRLADLTIESHVAWSNQTYVGLDFNQSLSTQVVLSLIGPGRSERRLFGLAPRRVPP